MTFSEGLEVQYENYIGSIRFVCNSYVTLCIHQFPGSSTFRNTRRSYSKSNSTRDGSSFRDLDDLRHLRNWYTPVAERP